MIRTPIYQGVAQSDLDMAGFDLLNFSGVGVGTSDGIIHQNAQNGAYQFVLTDAGKHVFHDSATAHDWTIPANASVPFEIGTAITIVNNTGAGVITLKITSDTLRRGDGAAATGDQTIAANSIATILKTKATEWFVAGVLSDTGTLYIGTDARLVSVTGGVKLEVRNAGTGTWVEATRYTNP
jgi:hypothetical protein